VTAFQVLEHVEAPGALFELAAGVSTDDARLWIAVPSHRRPTRHFEERDTLDQPPHHLTRWTESSLAAAGARCGWRLRGVDYEPLSAATRLWWQATRSRLYLTLVRQPATAPRAWERAVRWCHYPLGLLACLEIGDAMTGFSMLAMFEKIESVTSRAPKERQEPQF
jgi:hypothetical protein